jgi:hypothetical protein
MSKVLLYKLITLKYLKYYCTDIIVCFGLTTKGRRVFLLLK